MAEQELDEFAEFQDVGAAPSSEDVDEFAEFEDIGGQSDTSAKIAAQGVVGGAIDSGGLLAGAIGGAMLAAPIPVPGARILGGIIGAGVGMYGGGKARDVAAEHDLTFSSVEDLPPEQRPAGIAGESLGGALPFAGAPIAFGMSGARTAGKTFVGRWVNGMLNSAAKHPLFFLGGEISAAGSAAVGAGIAEAVDPGDASTRFLAETAGGILNPTKMAISATSGIYNRASGVFNRLSPSGRETTAGKMLNDLLISRAEDPVAIARILRNPVNPIDVKLNAAQITGSPTLGALQQNLALYSGRFGAEAGKQADEGMQALAATIDLMRKTGDPEALTEAAKMEKTMLRTLLASRLQQAEGAAMEAAMGITADTPAAKLKLSEVARDALDGAIKDSRKAESELWGLIPDADGSIDSLTSRFKEISADMLPESKFEDLPVIARQFIERINLKQAGVVTTKEITQFRSKMLSKARELSHAGKYDQARIHGELAEAALDDLNLSFIDSPEYTRAREFSAALNDTFTRSFAGKATATGRFGARIPPELMMTKAIATGKEAGAIQMQELENATRFLSKQGMGDDSAFDVMMDAQERMMRLGAAESIDIKTGHVNPEKLSKFIHDNDALMTRFPELKNQLQDAVDSEQARKGMESVGKKSIKIFETESEFARLLKKDPITLVNQAFNDVNQEKGFADLIKVAKKAGDAGKQGLKTSVIDSAMRRSTSQNGNLKFDDLEKLLFTSTTTGRKSPIEILSKSGIFTPEDVDRLKSVFKLAKKIGTSKKPGTSVDEIDDSLDVMVDLITRASGATIATRVAGATGAKSSGLIIAAGGSRAARQLLENIPNAQIKTILIDAMTNPELMIKLLEKSPTPQAKMEKMRFIHAFLIQSGVYNIKETLESEQETVGEP